jgi:hypothetical protein
MTPALSAYQRVEPPRRLVRGPTLERRRRRGWRWARPIVWTAIFGLTALFWAAVLRLAIGALAGAA